MLKHFKLSHHRHSGQLQAHEYTSYLPLMLLLVVVGLSLVVCSVSAATPHPDPQSGAIAVKGVMPGKPPAIPPVIKAPINGSRFKESPVTVSGTCESSTLIEVFKNDIFAGSSACEKGAFSFDVDLMYGSNVLVARSYDALNQAGPESNEVTITYDGIPGQASPISSLNFGPAQLMVSTDAVYRGIFPGEEFNVPITILGGSAPYAVSVDWGDQSNKIVPRADNQTFNLTHKYAKAGTYQVSLKVSDSSDRVAFLTVAAIINGQPPVASTATESKLPTSRLLVLWPLYTSVAAVVSSFWLGERREKKLLIRHGVLAR